MDTPRGYLEAIIQRTRELRERAGLKQYEMANMLGIERNRYIHYERIASDRLTILPIHLIAKFCALVGVSPQYLLTGHEHPVITAYNATGGESRIIVDRFLGLDKNDPLDPQIPTPAPTARQGAAPKGKDRVS